MKIFDGFILVLVLAFSFYIGAFTPLGPNLKERLLPPIELNLISQTEGRLNDYFLEDAWLDQRVDQWYTELSPTARAGQLIMPALDETLNLERMEALLGAETVGGFMILSESVTPAQVSALKTAVTHSVPLLVAVDAEPSLIKYRFAEPGFTGETSDLDTLERINNTTDMIASDLKAYGINLNFAPVYDLGTNQTVIGPRAFSDDPTEVITRANQMANRLMAHNIIPTAKHFPGHGLVAGDTHLEAQTITGELAELLQFHEAVKAEVPVIMVGHLTVQTESYDTLGLPATLSSLMMQDLLRATLGFEGVIVTDAMNMAALDGFENVDYNALVAGADIVLMPSDPVALNAEILSSMESSPALEAAFEAKIKRVLRLKLVWKLNKY